MKIQKFLEVIGAKGFGEKTTAKIYELGYRTVDDFIKLKPADIQSLGPKRSVTLVESIRSGMNSITVPALMKGSGSFGRGLGLRMFNKVLKEKPELIMERKEYTADQYTSAFRSIEGFGDVYAVQAGKGMQGYWEFTETLSPMLYQKIVANTMSKLEADDLDTSADVPVEAPAPSATATATPATSAAPATAPAGLVSITQYLKKKPAAESMPAPPKPAKPKPRVEIPSHICITGFRDATIAEFIERNGGKVQNDCNGVTKMVIRKDSSCTNKKTQSAIQRGVQMLTREEFKSAYMS